MRVIWSDQSRTNVPCCDALLTVDRESGGLLVQLTGEGGDAGVAEVAIVPIESSTAPSSDAIRTAAENLVVATGQRPFVQNLSTAPLFVKKGTGASATSFHFILSGGTANDDGLGGATPYGPDNPLYGYIGTVTFFSTDFRYVAWVQ